MYDRKEVIFSAIHSKSSGCEAGDSVVSTGLAGEFGPVSTIKSRIYVQLILPSLNIKKMQSNKLKPVLVLDT